MRDILPVFMLFLVGCDPVERPLGLDTCGTFRGSLASLPDLDLSTCLERCGANYDTQLRLIDQELAWLAFTPHCVSPADQESLKSVAFEVSIPRSELAVGNHPDITGWLSEAGAVEVEPLGFDAEISIYEERFYRGERYLRLGWDLPFGSAEDEGGSWSHLNGADWMWVAEVSSARQVSQLASTGAE